MGGGIVGPAVAYHLTTGVEMALFDLRDTGRATDAEAGILASMTNSTVGNKLWVHFALNTAAYYEQLDETLRSAGIEETGFGRLGL